MRAVPGRRYQAIDEQSVLPRTFHATRTTRKQVRPCAAYKSLVLGETLIEVRPVAWAVFDGSIVRRCDDGGGLIRRNIGLTANACRHVSQRRWRVIKQPVEHREDMRTGGGASLCGR